MAAQVNELIIKYRSDITELQTKVATLESTMKKVDTAAQKTSDGIKKGFKDASDSAAELQNKTNPLAAGFEKLGGALVGAFAVERIVAFGVASVHAFAEAEKAQLQLLNALGGQIPVQQRLIKQADDLQDALGIDNDVIVKQQAFLALQGRTESQITKTIQAAIQLSAVTGEDLASAVQKLDATYEGSIGRLGKLDNRFTDLTKSQLANGAAIDLVNEKYKGFAEAGAQSVSGQLEIQERKVDDLSKALGQKLAPAYLGAMEAIISKIIEATDAFSSFLDGSAFKSSSSLAERLKQIEETTKKTFSGSSIKDINDEINKLLPLYSRLKDSVDELTPGERNLKAALATQIATLGDLKKAGSEVTEERKKDVTTLQTLKDALEDLNKQQLQIPDPQGAGKSQNDAILKSIAETQAKIDEITGKATAERNKKAEEAEKQRLADIQAAFKAQQDANKKSADDTLQIQLANLEQAKQAVLGEEERSAQERLLIEIEFQKRRAKLFEDDLPEQAKINAKLQELDTQLKEQKIKDAADTAEALKKQTDKITADQEDAAKALIDIEKNKTNIILGIQQQATDFARQQIGSLYDERIASFENASNAQIKDIDDQLQRNQDLRDRDMISLRDYTETNNKLTAEKVAAEKRQKDEIAKIKTQQATAEKLFAILQIGVNTAQNVAKITAEVAALTAASILNPFLVPLIPIAASQIPLVIASGAVQAGIVAAQPIPKFKDGTKGAGGAMSIVGEEGPEFMFVPWQAKILTAAQTKRHSAMIDAMHDNRLQEHLNKFYINPALQQQEIRYKQHQDQNFATNVANSFMLQTTGITATEMDWIRRKGTHIKNADELAYLIAKEVAKAIPVQSSRRYSA